MARLHLLTAFWIVAALILFLKKNADPVTIAGEEPVVPTEWLASNPAPATPEKDRRPADQTFLTYPEWFLVHSPAEQAAYFSQRTSTSFPYVGHIRQFWGSYKVVYNEIRGRFAPNPGYHVMIWVIGVSTTVEYAAKAWYEAAVGWWTDTSAPDTEEDRFNAYYMQDYVDFIRFRPWYEYDYVQKLGQLWNGVPIAGAHPFRKLERRYYLTTELLVKAGYGWLIGLGTDAAYEEALPNTVVLIAPIVASIPSAPNLATLSQVRVLREDARGVLLSLPRYQAFAEAAMQLAGQGATFREVAGNRSTVLITALMPAGHTERGFGYITLFSQPILSEPGRKRVAFVTHVADLAVALNNLRASGKVEIEHVYDY